ncbi:MAG: SAM-dependent methyltransferase [Verrucomicrobiae bacterium]|nr:SAM-dependent methyltransferase [Verrucomicrobiae bacterium]
MEEIATAGGVLPFARFMEVALYAPELGYYERRTSPGRSGDFYTSVSVGPLFGELLAYQCSCWFDQLLAANGDKVGERNGPLDLVEAGAHDGRLAADVLQWFERWRPDLASRLRLWLVEPSATRRARQAGTLGKWVSRADWVSRPAELTARTGGGIRGVFYSNELLDAFPVHRLVWRRPPGRWEESGVGWAAGRFVWRPLPDALETAGAADRRRLDGLPASLREVLPDGQVLDVSPSAAAWWQEAAGSLRHGVLMTFDYGFDEEVPVRPGASSGSLRAYAQHRVLGDVLADPGGQDLTADVDVAAVARAGEAAGLSTEWRGTQRAWLTALLGRTLPVAGTGFPEWDRGRVRQFQTLTHPEHLGRRFRVLVQRRPPAVSGNAACP